MNGAHIHLILNHFPIIGVFMALFTLLYGMIRKKEDILHMALVLFTLSFLFGIPAYLSGEGAEEVVEHIPGISEKIIHPHEEAAEKAIIALAILGISSLAGLVYFSKKEKEFPQWFQGTTLALGLITLALLSWTANLGGKIHHPELRKGFVAAEDKENHEKEEGKVKEKEINNPSSSHKKKESQ